MNKNGLGDNSHNEKVEKYIGNDINNIYLNHYWFWIVNKQINKIYMGSNNNNEITDIPINLDKNEKNYVIGSKHQTMIVETNKGKIFGIGCGKKLFEIGCSDFFRIPNNVFIL